MFAFVFSAGIPVSAGKGHAEIHEELLQEECCSIASRR
jgi:hypothetical protein